jgi:PPE-repeat protein
MPDPAWPTLPPEANYLRLAGPGATGIATTVASAVAWQALMVSHEAAFALSTLNTAVTALNFEGVGGMSSATAITDLNTALQLLAGWVQAKPPILASAVAAYEAAVSSMIPAEVCIANRVEQAADVAINPTVLGALTPAIIALDTEYFGEYWPHNASVGAAYGATLSALAATLAIPPPISSPGAVSTAPVAAAAAVAQTSGRVAMEGALAAPVAKSVAGGSAVPTEVLGQVGQTLMQPIQGALGSMQSATGMFQTPVSAIQSLAGIPQSMIGSRRGIGPETDSGDVPVLAAALPGGAPPIGEPGVGAAGTGTVGTVGTGTVGTVGTGTVGPGGVASPSGVAGPGLTSYARPASSFAAETAGRPTGLKTGLLSAAEFQGSTPVGSGGPLPVSAGQSGLLGRGKEVGDRDDGPRARIVAGARPQPAQ